MLVEKEHVYYDIFPGNLAGISERNHAGLIHLQKRP